ncbi:hypothetical protein GCM10009601_41800 [Streptomyces thermospinosisporus]|uniref:Uncharacterized protein n=1 Tax=Streptomyces thermospinosisporus TaxID=161482 RepID=A0ABN1Z287_9ACTN
MIRAYSSSTSRRTSGSGRSRRPPGRIPGKGPPPSASGNRAAVRAARSAASGSRRKAKYGFGLPFGESGDRPSYR